MGCAAAPGRVSAGRGADAVQACCPGAEAHAGRAARLESHKALQQAQAAATVCKRLVRCHSRIRQGGPGRARHLQVQEHAAGDVLAGAGLREEGVEGVVAAADRLVRRHLAIGLDAFAPTPPPGSAARARGQRRRQAARPSTGYQERFFAESKLDSAASEGAARAPRAPVVKSQTSRWSQAQPQGVQQARWRTMLQAIELPAGVADLHAA